MAEWTYKDGWYRQYDLEKKVWLPSRAKWTGERARLMNADRRRHGITSRWVYMKKRNKQT